MAQRITKPITPDRPKFEFDSSFKETFNAMIEVFSKSMDRLNKVSSGKTINSEYGVCSCCYKLRYITPSDVSTYISNLIKALDNGLFHDRISDAEMFTVASVKRFIEANGCEPFESSSVLDDAHRYVNPKNQTLNDLAFICENDTCEVAVYSRGEMAKRIELMSDDVKKINDMHFVANMKKIIASLPSIIEKSDCMCCSGTLYLLTLTQFIEEFILFACTINTIAVLQLIGYGHPSVEYTVKPKDENSEDLVTECCLLKTNDYMIRNKIPFNCNMRDVVLQDVTPNFKDTHDALHFIMRDGRSPISVLVNRFATKEANSGYDYELVGSMFLGIKHHHGGSGEWHTKDGNVTTDCPRCVNGFRNKPAWIDTIAFGNNYLDGNYRRDAVGNNHSHPITNTLDTLYKVFGGCGLKTNEDIANNIVRVACLMREIIREYKQECVENYDLTKDILVMLGEILTRNMLRLYYNNTRVYAYDDNMPDAAAPGFICMESFIMEADGDTTTTTATTNNTAGQTTNTQTNTNSGNTNGKTTVSFTQNGQETKTALNVKASAMIQKFIQWVRTQLSKFSENFNKNHKKEIEWIKNNAQLNKEIGDAISKGTFTPNVSNLPKFNIPADKLIKGAKMFEFVQQWADVSKEFNAVQAAIKATGLDVNELKQLAAVGSDQKAQNEALLNYTLFGTFKKPQSYTGPLEAKQWYELCDDLLNTPDMIAKITKANTDDLTKATDFIQKKLQQLEMATGDQLQKNEPEIKRCKEINKIIQDTTKSYKVMMLNAMNNKFYSTNYTIYREIVAGYKQQSKNSTETTTQNTQTTETTNTAENQNTEPLDTSSQQTENK